MKHRNNNRYWIKSGSLTLLQSMVGVFFGFAGFYLLVRILDKHTYGAWTLFLGTITLLEFVRNGLIQNALIKSLASVKEADKVNVISASFTISGILTIACIILNLLFAQYLCVIWESPELLPLFHLYNVVFIFSGITAQFNYIEQANFSYNGIFLSSVIRQAILFVYILCCYVFRWELQLISLVYVQIMGVIIGVIPAYIHVKKFFQFRYIYHPQWMKNLFHFGKYSFGTSLGAMLLNTIDQMMLGAFLSPAAAGAYNIAVRITNLVEIPTGSVATIVFPQSAKRMETEGKTSIKYLYEKSVGTILAILIPGLLFLFFFSDWIVTMIAGDKYPEAVPVLKVTILYCLLIPYGRQFGTILDSIGKPRITFITVIISALINVILNYIFISRYGVLGAAYGTLATQVVGFIIGQLILRRELNVNLFNTLVYAKNFYPEFFHKHLRLGQSFANAKR
jgi:lipopolysaccharide exporter